MGGRGSGRRRQTVKATTSALLQLDVRRWQRDGLLVAGTSFGWQWMENGEVVDFILVQVESGRVILPFRRSSDGRAGRRGHYAVSLDGDPVTMAECAPGSFVQYRPAVDERRSSTEGPRLHAAAVTSWFTKANGRVATNTAPEAWVRTVTATLKDASGNVRVGAELHNSLSRVDLPCLQNLRFSAQ